MSQTDKPLRWRSFLQPIKNHNFSTERICKASCLGTSSMLCFPKKRKGNARISIDPVLKCVLTNQVIYQAKKRSQASLNFAKPEDKKATLIMLTWECNRVVIGCNQLSGQQPDQAQTKSSQGFFSIAFLQKGEKRSSDEKGDRAKWLDATDS